MVNVNEQQAEDLVGALGIDDSEYDEGAIPGMLFQDLTNVVSPGRRMTSLWSLEDGSEIHVMQYRRREFLRKRDQRGNRRFTANKDEAPPFDEGTYRCFLASDSPERLEGELAAAGLASMRCPNDYKHGRSPWAAQQHAEKKHKTEWRSWHEYLEKKERDLEREERRKEVEAMMAIARGAVQPAVVEPTPNGESSVVVTPTEVMDYDEFVKQDAAQAFDPVPFEDEVQHDMGEGQWWEGKSNKELKAIAAKMGIEFRPPSKYVSKIDIVKAIEGKQ